MFQQIIGKLADIQRFDVVTSSKNIKLGEVEKIGGGTQLAMKVEDRDPVVLEDHAKSQLIANWKIPQDHFDRLPRALQAEEFHYFAARDPKELTVRSIKMPGAEMGAARSVMSGKYSTFDIIDLVAVLQETLPDEGEWELARVKQDRDEVSLMLTRPNTYDVSSISGRGARVGDLVKTGIHVGTSEIGTMSTDAQFALWRLACLNGMQHENAAVSVKQRHIFVDKIILRERLKSAIRMVTGIGEAVVQQLRASHDMPLPNLDPDAGDLQKNVVKLLQKEGVWSRDFQDLALKSLGTDEEASLFGLVQIVTGPHAKKPGRTLTDQLAIERVAGRLMSLAA